MLSSLPQKRCTCERELLEGIKFALEQQAPVHEQLLNKTNGGVEGVREENQRFGMTQPN